MKMKDINSKIKGGRIYLKSFSGAKSKQLNHCVKPTLDEYEYDSVIVHVGLNDVLRCKNEPELEELITNIIETGETCQKYKLSKTFVSSIMPSSRTKINIKSINEKLNNLCFTNNFNFIDHQEIISNDIWVDRINLKHLGKARLAKVFANNFLGKNTVFLENLIWYFSVSFNKLEKEETLLYDCKNSTHTFKGNFL